jgi:hypothetical protein
MSPLVKRLAASAAIFIVFGALSNGSAQTTSTNATKPLIRRVIEATVWPGRYSEIVLMGPPVWCAAVSNIDFRAFPSRVTFETKVAVYDFVIIGLTLTPKDIADEQEAGYLDAKGFPRFWPQQLPPPGGVAKYVPLVFQPVILPSNHDLAILDALHQYYQANRQQLEAQAHQHPVELLSFADYQAALKAQPAKPAVSFKRIEHLGPSPTPHK